MESRYEQPETTLLHISQGDTLTVKKRLTYGERSESYARQYEPRESDGQLVLLPGRIKLSLVTAYLLDWSLIGRDGNRVAIYREPIDVVEASLKGLPPEDFEEIHDAIVKHEKAMLAARAREKKQKASSNDAGAILTSPSAVAGALTGSVS